MKIGCRVIFSENPDFRSRQVDDIPELAILANYVPNLNKERLL